MPLDPEAFADMVLQTVEAALGPERERLAVIEALVKQNADLRDRLVVMETKAAIVVSEPPVVEPVDLSPVLERVAALEARQAVLGDVRDRLVTVETKAAMPAPVVEAPKPVDLAPVIAPVLERLTFAEARLSQMGDRLGTVETKAAQPVPVPTVTGPSPAEQELALVNRVEPLTKQLAALSERLAVMEVRAPMPGPAGKDGTDGAPGLNGKDGADGLGFDDLSVDFDGDRRLELVLARDGGRAKSFPIVLPFLRYQGVYQDGKSYDVGDVTTWAGSTWHCQRTTTAKPGEGSADWVLIVKRGRDGKDGRDAPGLPIVSLGARP